MVDEYITGKTVRISPEAPVPIVEWETDEYILGGAGNVIRNLAVLGAQVHSISAIGTDVDGEWILSEFDRLRLNAFGIVQDYDRPTTKKVRIISEGQQLIRIDKEITTPIKKETEDKIIRYTRDNFRNVNVILVSDYMKGVLTERVLNAIINQGIIENIPVIIDPKMRDLKDYRDTSILTPNKKEAEEASGIIINSNEKAVMVGRWLMKETNAKMVLITRGEEGMTLVGGRTLKQEKDIYHIPAQAQHTYDITGAGDTVLAVFGLCIAAKLNCFDAAVIANHAASVVVGKVGTSVVTKSELLNAII